MLSAACSLHIALGLVDHFQVVWLTSALLKSALFMNITFSDIA